MKRETISKEQIRTLNQLGWDKRHYANFQFADGSVGLEINYTFGIDEYKYKVICKDWNEVESLRKELDP